MEGESSGDEVQCTGWSGGVAHHLSSDEEPDFISDDEGEEEDVEELSGSELEEAQRHAVSRRLSTRSRSIPYLSLPISPHCCYSF